MNVGDIVYFFLIHTGCISTAIPVQDIGHTPLSLVMILPSIKDFTVVLGVHILLYLVQAFHKTITFCNEKQALAPVYLLNIFNKQDENVTFSGSIMQTSLYSDSLSFMK